MYSSGGMVYSSEGMVPPDSCQASVFIVRIEQCKLMWNEIKFSNNVFD